MSKKITYCLHHFAHTIDLDGSSLSNLSNSNCIFNLSLTIYSPYLIDSDSILIDDLIELTNETEVSANTSIYNWSLTDYILNII
jgi:hypothetical protein